MLTVLIFIVSCESPMKIQINEQENIIGSEFNRNVLKDGGDFTIGYQNGNIQGSKVELSWSQTMEEDFAFYKLTRNNLELAVFNNVSVTTFVDTSVTENNYYDYQITVFAENGMVAKDTIEIKTPKWQSPSNLSVNGLNKTDVKLMWNDNSDSEKNFKVYFYDNTNRSLIDSFLVDANITEKIVTDLDQTKTYSFNVKAVNQWEKDTELFTPKDFDITNFVFYAPTNLTCKQIPKMSIELNWIDKSTLETGFSIERKINDSDFSIITNMDMINITTYTDYDTTAYEIGDTLTYRVQAYNDYETLEYTEYSDEKSIIVIESFSIPTPEHFFSGSTWADLEIEYPGETDVIKWTSYGNDLDVKIYNHSSTMDIAIRVWDEYGNFLGEFNNGGTGYDEYLYNIANGDTFIIEVFDVNKTSGSYAIKIS